MVLAVRQQHHDALFVVAGGKEIDRLAQGGRELSAGKRQRTGLDGVEQQVEHGDVDGERRHDHADPLRLHQGYPIPGQLLRHPAHQRLGQPDA